MNGKILRVTESGAFLDGKEFKLENIEVELPDGSIVGIADLVEVYIEWKEKH